MNSLQELNNFGGVSLDFTDNRSSAVKFDRVSPLEPLNRGFTITSLASVVTPGIEITEIINYATANVRYQVTIYPGDVTPLTGSSISFTNVPAHVTSSIAGNVYTLTGLRSVDDWLAVRQFTWTLPANYASKPYWHAEAKIIYYDSALGYDVYKSFLIFDFRFYFVAQLQATASITRAQLTGNQRATASISSTSALTCLANAKFLFVSTPPSAFTLSATPHILIENLTARAYTGNNENSIFSSDTPIIGDSNPSTTSTFDVILTSSLGTFSTSSTIASESPLTITGSLSTVNTALANLKFYPTAGSSSNGTVTFEVKKDTVSQATRTFNLTGTAGTYSANASYSFTSSAMFTPTNGDTKYALADILLVGGGGGSGVQGGGGGGGGVRDILNQTIAFQTYTITVGSGGIGASAAGPVGIPAGNGGYTGYAGGNTTACGFTAGGGGGGGGYLNLSGGVYTYNKFGGASGTPQSNAGGTYSGTTSSSSVFNRGGGGGGAGAVGSNGPSGNGGSGTTSSINSLTYGQGGGGYSAGTPNGAPTANSGRGGSDVDLYQNGADGFVLINFHA